MPTDPHNPYRQPKPHKPVINDFKDLSHAPTSRNREHTIPHTGVTQCQLLGYQNAKMTVWYCMQPKVMPGVGGVPLTVDTAPDRSPAQHTISLPPFNQDFEG